VKDPGITRSNARDVRATNQALKKNPEKLKMKNMWKGTRTYCATLSFER